MPNGPQTVAIGGKSPSPTAACAADAFSAARRGPRHAKAGNRSAGIRSLPDPFFRAQQNYSTGHSPMQSNCAKLFADFTRRMQTRRLC